MLEWALADRRLPTFRNRAAGVLPRLRAFTKIAHHRIDGTLQLCVPAPDRLLHLSPFSIRPEPLKLLVRIKDERRPRKSSCDSRTVGMQADDIKGLPGEAKRKLRIRRVRGNTAVPIGIINLVQQRQLSPKSFFKFDFVERDWSFRWVILVMGVVSLWRALWHWTGMGFSRSDRPH